MQTIDFNKEAAELDIQIKKCLIEIKLANLRTMRRNRQIRFVAFTFFIISSVLLMLAGVSLEIRILTHIHLDLSLLFAWYATGSESFMKES